MEVKVLDKAGKETGKTVKLNDEVFAITPNDHAIYLDTKQYLANTRQGTAKSKERGEISGSTRKLKRQKGTGGARAGSIKSPLFRGGGTIFGPRPRNYSFKLNKKVKQLARRSALTYKAGSQSILVVEDFSLDNPKTKEIVNFQKNLNVSEVKTLIVLPSDNKQIYLSARNIPNVQTIVASNLNTYKILNAKSLIFFESSLEIVEKNLTK
ncbi:MAG: 50S ribosomal protein L4 [Bacteroidales bacterium]